MTEPRPSDAENQSAAYAALHLAPSAPHDLVTEVYWHLARALRRSAEGDGEAAHRLAEVNEAYAALVSFRQSAPPLDEQATPSVRRPWEFLHLHSSAPSDVVRVAYDFWRLQVRAQLGDTSDEALVRLRQAYESMIGGPAEVHAGPDDPEEPLQPEPDVQTEAADPLETRSAVAVGETAAALGIVLRGVIVAVVRFVARVVQIVAPIVWRWLVIASAFLGRLTMRCAREGGRLLRTHGPPAARALGAGVSRATRFVWERLRTARVPRRPPASPDPLRAAHRKVSPDPPERSAASGPPATPGDLDMRAEERIAALAAGRAPGGQSQTPGGP